MYRTIFITALFGAASLMGTAAYGQQDSSSNRQLQESDLQLHYYHPQNVSLGELHSAMRSLYGRTLALPGRQVLNLMVVEDSILLYETPDNIARILDGLKLLDSRPGQDGKGGTPSVDPLSLSMHVYVPIHADPQSLMVRLRDTHGRVFRVNGNRVDNISSFDKSLMIQDEPNRVKQIVASAKAMDDALKGMANPELTVKEFSPRNISLSAVQNALMPYQRSVLEVHQRFGGASQTSNFSIIHDRGIVIIRETEDRMDEMIGLLERIDKPAPQVNLTCYVLKGTDEVTEDNIPKELTTNLRQMLPYKDYSLEALGVLRASAVGGNTISMQLEAPRSEQGASQNFTLDFMVGAFDSNSGKLQLDQCKFAFFSQHFGSRQLFNTSTSIRSGEYAVLGVAGNEPIFVVLQVTPIGELH